MVHKKKRIYLLLIIFKTCIGLDNDVSRYQELITAEQTGVVQLQFPYNINSDYVDSTGTGSVTQANSFAQVASGASGSSSAVLQSKARLNLQAGQSNVCTFACHFTAGVAGNTQEIGIGNVQDGFFFGYNGTSFGIMSRRNSVDTWVLQGNWNGDLAASGVTLQPTNGNVYKIEYQGIGFGIVKFYIENPNNGLWILVHTIRYPNNHANAQVLNSSLRLYARSNNSTNSSNVTLFIAGMSAAIQGRYDTSLQKRGSAENAAGATLTTTYNNVVSIRNDSLFHGVSNQGLVYVDRLSIFQPASASQTEFTLFINPTVTGASFTPFPNNSESIVSVDTAGTTVTSGNPNYGSFFVANNQRFRQNFYSFFGGAPVAFGAPFQNDEDFDPEEYTFDLSCYNIVLNPGDRLVVAARTIAGGGTGYAALSWSEKL